MTESIQEANAITHKRNFRSQRKPFRKFNRNVKAKFKPQAKNGDINGAGNTFNIYSSTNLTSWTNSATIV